MYRKSLKTYCAFLVVFLGTTCTLAAQGVLFSKPFRAQIYASFEVLGKIGPHYTVLEKGIAPYGKTFLRFFDQEMNQVGNKKRVDLPPGANNLRFLAYDSFLLKTYVQKAGNNLFLMAAIMDGFTQSEKAPIILDSMNARIGTLYSTWDVIPSQNKSKLLVQRINYGNDSALLTTTIFNARLQNLQASKSKIFINAGQEVIGQFFISNQGDTYFTIQPVKGGMNKFEILSKPFTERYYRSMLIDLKNKYLNKSTINFTLEEGRDFGTLLMNATYFSNINNPIDEGFFSARVNTETNRSTAVFNPLADSNLSIHNINLPSNPIAQITLNHVFKLTNGGLMLLGEIDRGRNIMVGKARDYLNQTITDPRYIYAPGLDNQYGMHHPMDVIHSTYLPKNKVEPYNKDIVVSYLDSSLQLQRQTVIEKDQRDIKTEMPLYLSFGAVNTATGIHVLYRERQKGGGILRNTRFSTSGEMVRLPPLKTIYEKYKLIPSAAKQVGLRQVIVPGKYRGRSVIARIDL